MPEHALPRAGRFRADSRESSSPPQDPVSASDSATEGFAVVEKADSDAEAWRAERQKKMQEEAMACSLANKDACLSCGS